MKREQIIKILNEELSVIIEQVDIPGGTIIGKKIIIGKEEAADEILALSLYPKEFVEWIGSDAAPCYLEEKEDGHGSWFVFTKRNSMEKEEFKTLNEVYQYWKQLKP